MRDNNGVVGKALVWVNGGSAVVIILNCFPWPGEKACIRHNPPILSGLIGPGNVGVCHLQARNVIAGARMFDISAFLVVAFSWLAFLNGISRQQLDGKFTFYRCVGWLVVRDGYGWVWGSSSDPEKNCAAGKSDFCSGWMKRHKRRLTLICSKRSPQFCMMMLMMMIG